MALRRVRQAVEAYRCLACGRLLEGPSQRQAGMARVPVLVRCPKCGSSDVTPHGPPASAARTTRKQVAGAVASSVFSLFGTVILLLAGVVTLIVFLGSLQPPTEDNKLPMPVITLLRGLFLVLGVGLVAHGALRFRAGVAPTPERQAKLRRWAGRARLVNGLAMAAFCLLGTRFSGGPWLPYALLAAVGLAVAFLPWLTGRPRSRQEAMAP